MMKTSLIRDLAALFSNERSNATGRSRRGFTLVELMIGVVLVGVLMSIAYPTYKAQIAKGKVSKAITDIGTISLGLERHFTDKSRYPASLAAAGLAMDDPWGRPYQYLDMDGATVGQMRKDKSLHPLNTDYDLYSKGPDGASSQPLTAKSSRDDIVRANNGGFVGVASDY